MVHDEELRTKVAVIIPAFNEEKTIATVVVGARKLADVVVVCDDGSTDMTADIAEALGARVVKHERNMGKGRALKDLVDEARKLDSDVVVTMDADSQHDPRDIPTVAAPVLKGEADVVIGVRPAKSGVMPRERIIGNKLLDEATSRKAGVNLKDTQSGFRAYSRRALDLLDFNQPGMAVESQTIIDAAKAGLKIAKVPVSTTYVGIQARRNPVAHFSSVLDYVLSRTVVESPLLYLGLPGLVGVLIGIVAGLRVIDLFLSSHQVAIGTGLIAVILILIGSIMLSTSLILKFLKAQMMK